MNVYSVYCRMLVGIYIYIYAIQKLLPTIHTQELDIFKFNFKKEIKQTSIELNSQKNSAFLFRLQIFIVPPF